MNYMIKELPEYKIAYMRRIGEYGIENYQLMEKLKNWAKRKGLLKRDNIICDHSLQNFILLDVLHYYILQKN